MAKSLALGTIRVMKRWHVEIHMIKVSHHGNKWERWRPLSYAEAEKHCGPLPTGHQVYHRDGDSLNDALENLIVARSQRIALNLERSRVARRKQRRRRASGVRKSNRVRSLVDRTLRVRLRRYYLVDHATRTIIFVAYRTKKAAESASTGDEFAGRSVVAVRGIKLVADCAKYLRFIPREGQAWVWRNKGPKAVDACDSTTGLAVENPPLFG
jgi:hypothetical protein